MARLSKSTLLADMLKGRVGELTLYTRNGQPMAMYANRDKRKNNHRGQLMNTIRWGNVVKCWRQLNGYDRSMQDNFETKMENQFDYNVFMKLNAQHKPGVYFTKQMNTNQACVLTDYQISEGSLPPLEFRLDNDLCISNILITPEFEFKEETTVDDLAVAICGHNREIRHEHHLKCYFAEQEIHNDIPHVNVWFVELELSCYDQTRLKDRMRGHQFVNADGYLAVPLPDLHGFGMVHCCPSKWRTEHEKVPTSTQRLIVNNSLLATYTSQEMIDAALLSYKVRD